jgi:hypothetical protein
MHSTEVAPPYLNITVLLPVDTLLFYCRVSGILKQKRVCVCEEYEGHQNPHVVEVMTHCIFKMILYNKEIVKKSLAVLLRLLCLPPNE